MKQRVVRIESINLSNFKNVVLGELSLSNPRKGYASSVLGLYGQNGSGKTALIDAIALLKYALCGQSIPSHYGDFIHVDSQSARLSFELSVADLDTDAIYRVKYEFSIRQDVDESSQNTDNASVSWPLIVTMFDEVLSYSYEQGEEKEKLLPVIDTRGEGVFGPKTKYDILTGKNRDIETDLLVAKKIAMTTSRSFIFSKELLNVVREHCSEKRRVYLIDALVNFGNFELFVINTSNSGMISMNAQPLSFKYEDKSMKAVGNLMLPLGEAATIPQGAVDLVKRVIENMNIVLLQIVPGLTIGVKELGTQLLNSGQVGIRVQLVSHKNSKDIPLKYESEGIKKIVSVLQLLVVVYNKPSITVAIDELDSGVFEYLLGEILRIISEKGKGQLIFTSHNLRPLETLDRGFVAFTTTNPTKRYIRLNNVKANNNLRDFYYRDIVLGEQQEAVYEPTNNYEIALAFREAGELSGS